MAAPTTAEGEREAVARALVSAAAERFGADCQLRSLTPLPGGHSGLTWSATLRGAAAPPRLVVKSAPLGREPVGRHDVLRQARAIEALRESAVEVPRVLLRHERRPELFAMEHVDGYCGEPIFDQGERPEPAAEIGSLWRQAVAMLVNLGSVDPTAVGLGDERCLSATGELERWAATALAAGEKVGEWAAPLAGALGAREPAPPPRPAIVHGDFRLGNMLRAEGRIKALIDWEIWSLGDPRTDLGWLLLFTEPSTFPGLGRAAPGLPEAAAVLAEYEERSGAAAPDAAWFRAMACFKLGSIQAHNLRRHREGRRHDPFLERFEGSVRALFDRGCELLQEGD